MPSRWPSLRWIIYLYFHFNLQISIEPLFSCITSNHVIIASREAFYVWHFRTAQSWTTLRLNDSGKQLDNSQNLPKNERYFVQNKTCKGALYYVLLGCTMSTTRPRVGSSQRIEPVGVSGPRNQKENEPSSRRPPMTPFVVWQPRTRS